MPLFPLTHLRASLPVAFIASAASCAPSAPPPATSPATPAADAAPVRIVAGPEVRRPPFAVSVEDDRLLEEVQHGAFNFLWAAADPTSGLAPDRATKPTLCSVAGVGFQLSALPIGVEHGWITIDQGRERATLILNSLTKDPNIRHAGFYQHFLDSPTASLHNDSLEYVVSTIDSTLLFCGVLTAGQYFGGEVSKKADAIFAEADFQAFLNKSEPEEWKRGFVSLGWQPRDPGKPAGAGRNLPYSWLDSGCEHRLVTLLGVCAPSELHRLDPALYYRLRRTLGDYPDIGPMVWFPYSGALFVNQFSHCWINYASIGPDDPSAFGFPPAKRASVDWWENARRITLLHRAKAIENPRKLPTFSENAWGLSASDCPKGYCVPGVFPRPLAMPGAQPRTDFAIEHPKDDFGDGTIAPYAAATSIMFTPTESLAALRYYRSLTKPDGTPLIWKDPATGGYGFADSFNLGPKTPWVAPDYVAIDQGPMLLAIENARTGLIWRIFHAHPFVKAGMERLRLHPKQP